MELANGKTNNFFSSNEENRYLVTEEELEEIKCFNNIQILTKDINEGSTVLDIGCSYGRIGQELFQKNCIVYGIDKDEAAARMAIENNGYKDVFLFDLDENSSDEYRRMENTIGEVDTIVFSDVLEHLVDPTSVLVRYVQYLKDNGNILVSVPNIAHMDIVLHLLNGEFNYTDMGILDNTHLKFFTKRSFAQWINKVNEFYQDINIDCEYIGATIYNNVLLKDVILNYEELATILQKSSEYNAFQIMFKLTKKSLDQPTSNLTRLLKSEHIDVVDILGKALKGKIQLEENHNIHYGERLWYENKISELEGNSLLNKEQYDYIIKQKEYIDELEKNLRMTVGENNNRDLYINELEQRIREADIQDKNLIINTHQYNEYIKELEDKAQEIQLEKEKRDQYIQELESNLNGTIHLCTQKDDYIVELENKINTYESVSIQKDNYLKELEDNLKETLYYSSKKDEYIQELEENLKEASSNNSKKDEYIQELEAKINLLFEQHHKKDSYIEELEQRLNQNVEVSERRLEYIEELEARLKELSLLIEGKDNYITELEHSVHDHISKVNVIEDGIKWHQNNQLDLEKEIENLKNNINELQAKIFTMENSTSWKFTKFLRK